MNSALSGIRQLPPEDDPNIHPLHTLHKSQIIQHSYNMACYMLCQMIVP